MNFTISFYSDTVEEAVLALPETLLARYFALADRMLVNGPNLGESHTDC